MLFGARSGTRTRTSVAGRAASLHNIRHFLTNLDRASIRHALFFGVNELRILDQVHDGGHMFRTWQVACTLTILVFTMSAFAQENTSSARWTATMKKGDKTGTATLNMTISGTGVAGTLSDPSGQVWQIESKR